MSAQNDHEAFMVELDTMRATLDEAATRFFLDVVPPIADPQNNQPQNQD